MSHHVYWECVLRRTIGLAGVVAALLSISVGLQLFAQQGKSITSMGGMLLTLVLANWSYTVGLAGLIALPVWMLVLVWKGCRETGQSI